MTTPTEALSKALALIEQDRRALLESHAYPPGSLTIPANDLAADEALAQYDEAIHAIRAALAEQPTAVVYPPDGTASPFTVINLGTGRVQMGDSIHDGRLPALWFGKNGQGMGHEEVMNRQAHEGETLAVVTFANVEGLDVLADVIQRIRRVSFPGAAPQQTAPQPSAEPADWWFRSRTADLLHLLEFSAVSTATGGDDLQAQRVMAELKAALSAAPQQTAPQAPTVQPLTDAQIDAVTDQQWAGGVNLPIYAAHRAYARAIERAHGITATPAPTGSAS